MTDVKFTAVSKLMQNYESGTPIDYHKAIAATSDKAGNLLFFSIGSDGHIYGFSQRNNTPTGWQRTDLSEEMEDYKAILLAAEQDETGTPLLAAVMESKSTKEVSVFFTRDFAEGTGKRRWVFRGKKGGVKVTAIAAGHGKAGAVLIVITTQDGDKTTNFLVNPDIEDHSWFWKEVPSPVDCQRVISTAIGHNSRLESIQEVQGLLYSLYQTSEGGESWMVVTSLPDFTFYNHAIPLDFNPTAFGVSRGAGGNTELIVGDKTLYHLSPAIQMERDGDQVKKGLQSVTSQPMAHNVKTIEVGMTQDKLLETWFLTEDGVLYRACQGNDGKWISPLPFQGEVGAMTAWRSADKNLHDIFTVDLNNRLRLYCQDSRTTLWKGSDILVESLDTHREITTYVTQFQITDENGMPMANQKITVRASELTPLTINHSVYYVDADSDAVQCETDALGNLTISNTVDGLPTPTLRLQADALGSQVIDVSPAAEIHHQLSSLTVEQLKDARMQTDTIGVTQPMLPGKSADDLQGTQEALQHLTSLSKQLPNESGFPAKAIPSEPVQYVTRTAGTPFLNRVAYGTLPAGYRWGMDFTGAHPVFTTDQDQIQRVHLAKLGVDASAPALLKRSVLDDVKHFFGDVWHAIEHGFIKVEHWVVQKVSDGLELIISTAEKVYKVVVKYAEQVWSIIQYVFQEIGAFFKELVRWLGFIFAWKDILRTHNVIRTTLNHCFDKFVAELPTAQNRIHDAFTELKNRIAGKNLAGPLGDWAHGDIKSVNTSGGHPFPLKSPDANWALHHASSQRLIQHGDATPASEHFSFFQSLEQDVDQLKTMFKADILDLAQQKISIEEFLRRIIKLLEVAVIDAVEALVQGMLEAVKLIVDGIRALLNTEWRIPLITPLYHAITDGSKLTLIDLASLLAAIPATVLYKIATDKAPFSDSEARTLTGTRNMNELLDAIINLDQRSMPHLVAAEGPTTQSLSPPAAAVAAGESKTLPPEGARRVSYAFGFSVGAAWMIYGLTNGIMVAAKPKYLPAGDKIKLGMGIIVNGLSIVPMALVLHYAGEDIPAGTKEDLPRLRYESFVTVFQVLFNVKDGLTTKYRDTDPESPVDPAVFFDLCETVLGVLNFIWYVALAIAERVEGDMNEGNRMKTGQNIASSFTQILSVGGDIVESPIIKGILTALQIALGLTPGILTCIRTDIERKSNKLDEIR